RDVAGDDVGGDRPRHPGRGPPAPDAVRGHARGDGGGAGRSGAYLGRPMPSPPSSNASAPPRPIRVVETRSRKLRVLEEARAAEGAPVTAEPIAVEPIPPKPDWIRMKMPVGEVFFDLKKHVRELGLHTVCESASCPNIGECWNRQSLTIIIVGGICPPSCQLCDVPTGRPEPPDPDEPERVAAIL